MLTIKPVRSWRAGAFAILDTAWAVILLGFALGHHFGWLGLDRLPDPIGGVIPLAVPWAGAAGGVAISLVGVCRHAANWDGRWNYWHLFRVLLGTVFGSVGVLIAALFVGSIAGVGSSTDFADLSAPSVAILAVIAFVVGFRESTIRELISRVADTIFTPAGGKEDDLGGASAVAPTEVDFGTVAVGDTATRLVRVSNAGSDQVPITGVSVSPEVAFTVLGVDDSGAAGGPLPGGAARSLGVQFAPTLEQAYRSEVTLMIGDDVAMITLSGQGGPAAAAQPPLTETEAVDASHPDNVGEAASPAADMSGQPLDGGQ